MKQSLAFREGYRHALVDLSGWICHPVHPLDKKLFAPKHLEKLLHFIIDDVDRFMSCPDNYCMNYKIEKRKLTLWREADQQVRCIRPVYTTSIDPNQPPPPPPPVCPSSNSTKDQED